VGFNHFVDAPTLGTATFEQPIVRDFTGQGTRDVLALAGTGYVLDRHGTGVKGVYEPPLVINPGNPANAMVLFSQGRNWILAVTDRQSNAVTLYQRQTDGSWTKESTTLPTGALPGPIVVGDLYGDGRKDLVVRNQGDGTLSIFHADPNASGGFDA